jgi:hypothetical protein
MPLKPGKKNIGNNVKRLVREGYKRTQAVAIAVNVAKRKKRKKKK